MTDPQERLDAEARADDEAQTEAAAEPEIEAEPAAATDEETEVAATSADDATAAEDEAAAPAPAAAKRERRARPQKAPPAPRPLSPYAIIETGGKQYRVSVGDRLSVEKLTAEAGTDITFERVLLLGGDGATRVGTPTVAGASVTATVEEHFRGDKIIVFKYKPKKRYRRRQGHRQSLTRLAITAINT